MEVTPKDSTKGRKRVHSADQNEDYYLKKIKNLVRKKWKLFCDQEQEETNEKKKMNSKPPPPLATIPSLEEFVANEMNGRDLTLVIKKILYASDLAKTQNRLSMPMNQLETLEFLTEKEKRELDNMEEFEVKLVGPRLQVYDKSMAMTMWRLKCSNSYVLRTNRNEFVKENDDVLKEKTKIQVWSFRSDKYGVNCLYFALVCV